MINKESDNQSKEEKELLIPAPSQDYVVRAPVQMSQISIMSTPNFHEVKNKNEFEQEEIKNDTIVEEQEMKDECIVKNLETELDKEFKEDEHLTLIAADLNLTFNAGLIHQSYDH